MLTFEYRNLLHSELIPTAIPESYIHNYAHACKQANEEIQSDRQAGFLGFYDLPDQDVSHILNFMASLDPKYNTMVVLGIGGSALGNKALYSALKTERNLDKKLFVYDNVDPVFLFEIIDQINLDTTIFNVISKSGTTAETMAAYLNGLLHYLYFREGKNIAVMMPYSNSLYDLADWYRQLWAESLGKRYDLKGREILVGQTPVKALGATDQHSQIQLYTEGPYDKVITFLTVLNFQYDYTIPNLHPESEDVSYLGGHKLSELLNAERLATEIALTKAKRPNANIIFPKIDEFHLGEFIMMYEIQTVFTGKLLNINPLDQPGVEAGKKATYALMGKPGYEKEREEIEQYLQKLGKK